jgi:RNA polymerase sigma factor (sigma-70 family)
MHDTETTLSRTLEEVIHRYHGLLSAVGHQYGLSPSDVDALVQDVRIRLWRALGDAEKIAGAATFYVKRTALSAAVDLIRRRRARHEAALENVGPALEKRGHAGVVVDQHGREEAAAEARARLESALAALAPSRKVVVRLYLTGYNRMEIAELTGWTEPKVRNLLYRGLADVRRELGAVEAESEEIE